MGKKSVVEENHERASMIFSFVEYYDRKNGKFASYQLSKSDPEQFQQEVLKYEHMRFDEDAIRDDVH